MDGTNSQEKYFKTPCSSAQSSQFYKQNYGFFTFDSLNEIPPSDPNSVIDIGYFPFDITVPHFQREINIDSLYLRNNLIKNVEFNIDGNDMLIFQFTGSPSALNYPCTNINSNLNIQQFFRARFKQNQITNNAFILRISEQMESNLIQQSLLISSIQVNVNTCHPSCLTCSGSNENQCLSCQYQNVDSNGMCKCSDSQQFLENGKCVQQCGNQNGYFQKSLSNQFCFFISKQCLEWNSSMQKCNKCLQPLLPQNENCVQKCSAGYEKFTNANTLISECVFTDRNKQGQIVLTGLHNNFFSSFEIERLGFTLSYFKQINQFSTIYSNCGGYQLLGGFFINKKGSIIQYDRQLGSDFQEQQQIKVFFKYFLIDYQFTQDSQIQIQLNDQTQTIQVSQTSFSASQNICGLDSKEIVGDTYITSSIPLSRQITLKISNNNPNSDDTTSNNITYFGIREVTIFLYKCNVDFCKDCDIITPSVCTVCQDGYYFDKGICIQCDLSCKTCINSSNCLTCLDKDAILNSNQKCQCPSNKYFDKQQLACKSCANVNCEQCQDTNSNVCISCSGSKGLLNNNCVDSCGKRYFKDSNICQGCIANCQECQDSTSCNICDNGFFQLQTCLDVCPDGYFQNTDTNKCDQCNDSNCLNCQKSAQTCTKCKDSFLVTTSFTCDTKCLENEYINNGVCDICKNKISNCYSCSQNTCLKCLDTFYLSLDNKYCMSSCPQEQVGVDSTGLCAQCQEGCLACDKNDLSKCSSCKTGFFLENQKCMTSCQQPGYFGDIQSNQCKLCNIKFSQCYQCTADKCLSCDGSTSYKYLDINNIKCIQNCYEGQYYSSSKKQCQSCSGNNNCYTCQEQYTDLCVNCRYSFAHRYYLYQEKCYEQCPSGTYLEPNQTNDQKICKSCQDTFNNCKECTNNVCTQCQDTFCFDPTYKKCIQTNNCDAVSCQDQNCLICQNSGICTECKEGFFLFNDRCVQQCNDGFYQDKNNNKCIDCQAYLGNNCSKCSVGDCINTNCSVPPYYEIHLRGQQTQCVQKCYDNLYPDSNGICRWCYNQDCKECDPNYPQNCTSCYQNFFLQNNQCVDACSKGYYLSGQTCKPCERGCMICTANECQQCINANQLLDPLTKQCVDTCQQNYFPGLNNQGQKLCMLCPQLFKGCQDCDSNQCNLCVNNQQVFDPVSRQCQDNCPKKYYNSSQICKQCEDNNCEYCDPQQPSRCTSCFQSSVNQFFQSEEGKCVSKCAENEYLLGLNCIKCSSKFGEKCSQCTVKKCIICSDSSYFISVNNDFSCVSVCPTKQFGDPVTKKCAYCKNSKCNQCDPKNQSYCQSCITDGKYPYLLNSDCVEQCPSNNYIDDSNSCQPCSKFDNGCVQCSKDNCKKCVDLSFLIQDTNKCLESCPQKYYESKANNLWQCLKCPDDNCIQCDLNKPTNCIKCNQGFYFNQNQQKCSSQCEFNQYGDDITSQCIDCNKNFKNCEQCTDKLCLKCEKDYFQVEGDQRCYEKCPYNNIDKILVDPNYDMSQNKQCQKCKNDTCAACDPKDLSVCLTCTDQYQKPYLYEKNCIQNCDKYQILDKKICYDECPKDFGVDEASKQCLECPNYVQNKECVDQCKQSTFINPESPTICVDCEIHYSQNCSICDINECKQCINNNYLFDNKCYDQCPTNTFIVEGEMKCTNKCDNPLFIQGQTCQKKCLPGHYIFNQNDQNICKKCSTQCKECEKTADTCIECFEGEGQDCFDLKSIKNQTEKEICKELSEKDIDKCQDNLKEQSQKSEIFSFVSQISLMFSLLVILLSHSFSSILSLFYLQNFQMLANYTLLSSNKFLLVKETALRFLLNYNALQMAPNPFQNDKNSSRLTNFSLFDTLLPFSNLSKSSFGNVFYEVCVIFVIIILIVVNIKNKNNLRFMQYLRNNLFIKIFMISTNLILLSCLHQIYNQQFYGTVDVVFLVASVSLYAILWGIICKSILGYQVKYSIQEKFYQKEIYTQNLVTISIFRKLFWVFYELKKIASIFFIILYPQNDNSIWIVLPLNLAFAIYVSVIRPFELKYQNISIALVEAFTIILLISLPFAYSIESVSVFIYLAIGVQCLTGFALFILIIKSSYFKLKQCKFKFPKSQKPQKAPKQKQQEISLEINNSLTFPNNNTTEANFSMIKKSFMPKTNFQK